MTRLITTIATVGEVEYYVYDVEVDYSICKSIGGATFYLDIAYKDDIVTFDEVSITVNGDQIFGGFVEMINTSGFPATMQIVATSEIIKADRTWFKQEYISYGESAVYWAGKFLSMSSISNYTVDVQDTTVYPGHSWGFQTAKDALTNIAQLVDARFYPDRTGEVYFKTLKTDGIDSTITDYSEVSKTYTNIAMRNKVMVFGSGVSAVRESGDQYLAPGETRTLAVSSALIQTIGTADHVVNQILSVFSQPMEIFTYVIEGDALLSLNDYVATPDDTGAITSLSHSISDDKGFVTTVTIGEICPNFFGMDILEDPYMFLSGTSLGVWKSGEDGVSWANISGTTLVGATVPAIHSDGTYLWAITSNNIYRSAAKDGQWTLCSMPSVYLVSLNDEQYVVEKANLELVDIVTNLEDSSRCFVVAYDTLYEKTVVLFSEDLYTFNRIFMV